VHIGIAADHGGFALKEDLRAQLAAAGHVVLDFGSYKLDTNDDFPNFVIPLSQAVASGKVERGIAVCSSGVGAAICANKIPGARASLINDHYSAEQGVEDDHMNVICLGGRVIGSAIAWDLIDTFLSAHYSQAERFLRRLGEIAALERKAATGVGGPMVIPA
jgi:ribose 5-phosphate isomerase B